MGSAPLELAEASIYQVIYDWNLGLEFIWVTWLRCLWHCW